MKKFIGFIAITLCAASLPAIETANTSQVRDDAKTILRILEVSGRNLPKDILQRIVAQDLAILRGERSEGSYQWASYRREPQGQVSDSFTIPDDIPADRLAKSTIEGDLVYELRAELPARRLLFIHNRRTWLDHVELEYTPVGGEKRVQTIQIGVWLGAGETKSIPFPAVAAHAKATTYARVEKGSGGPSTLVLSLVRAELVDEPSSPFYEDVQTTKMLDHAIDRGDAAAIRSLSQSLVTSLEGKAGLPPQLAVPPAVGTPPQTSGDRGNALPDELQPMPTVEIYLELQHIEDLLTGSEGERRDGLDRLHQLIRRLRPHEE
ncbi:MAG: hypothetical protein WBX15_05135 [Thermoanaerobaculia bacterium]